MAENEQSSTATIAISLGGSINLLKRLGIISEDAVPGAGAAATLLIANDYNPDDPLWYQFLDQLIPDEVGVAVELSVQDGVGLGGHLALEGTLYPNLSPQEVLTNENVSIQGMAYGGGGAVIVDENNQLTGAGVLLGAGLGLEVAVSGPALGLTFNAEDLSFTAVVDDQVYNLSVNQFSSTGDECFVAGTMIDMWPLEVSANPDGSYDQKTVHSKIWREPIEEITDQDWVVAFDARGNLVPGRVTQILPNVTETWLKLSDGTVVTPGHRFLRPDGSFAEIKDIIAGDGQIVLQDGSVQTVTAEVIHYSAETAHLFEQGEMLVAANAGATALAPDVKRGWKTYNFTVAEHHTYIANGIRVHNDSILSQLQEGDQLIALNDSLTDAAVFRGVNGDGHADFVTLDGFRDQKLAA